MTKGVGQYQIDKEAQAKISVLKALDDEKEHRYNDIKEKTGLKDPTVTKYLKQFVEQKLITKKVDITSGKYPYPAYYKIKPMTKAVLEVISTTEHEKHEIEQILLDSKKTPLDVLDQLNIRINSNILLALKICKEDKNASPESLNSMLRLFVWQPYEILTAFLIEESKKIIEKIDIDYLIESNKSTKRLGKNDLKSLIQSLNLGLSDKEIDDVIAKC